jgi:Matrixin
MSYAMRWVILGYMVVLSQCGCHQQVNWNGDPQWQAVPLKVEWRAASDTFNTSFTNAMEAWNHAAGCTLLEQAKDGEEAQVSIGAYEGTACGRDAGIEDVSGATAGTWRCDARHAEVKFRVLSDIMSAFVIAEHEFGHVLGLAHDGSALMNPSPRLYDPAALGGAPSLFILPSDADGAAVGARYCR